MSQSLWVEFAIALSGPIAFVIFFVSAMGALANQFWSDE